MQRFRLAPVVLGASFFACGGGRPSAPVNPGALDRGEAAREIANAKTRARAECSSLEGPRGNAHVTTTVAPAGNVVDVAFDVGYLPDDASLRFVGTPKGDCVLRSFRSIRLTAFAGAPTPMGTYLTLD